MTENIQSHITKEITGISENNNDNFETTSSKMETKDELIKCIKAWVKIDNEIRILQKEQSTRRKEKKNITDALINVMKENEIDCFDITNGQLIYNRKNVKKPITQKNLHKMLLDYFEGDATKTENIENYIIENREESVKETITRKIWNTDS